MNEVTATLNNEPAYFAVSFWSLDSLVRAKLILGRFRDAVLPDFSRFPAVSDDYLSAFFTDPRHRRYFGTYVPVA